MADTGHSALQLTAHRARLLRLEAQQLADRRPASGEAVVRAVRERVGVQAQEPLAARLALRARIRGLEAAAVEAALVRERLLVRTWALRGTLHLVAAGDLAWLLGLLAPGLIRGGERRRLELGLDAGTSRRGVDALDRMLRAEGPLTRAEIAARLAASGIPTAGQATFHLIALAGLESVLCYGPDRDREATYVALEDWLEKGPEKGPEKEPEIEIEPGPVLPPEDAAAELARRYLAGYGPATPEDLATWSGLKVGEARAAWRRLEGRLLEVTVRGAPAWLLAEDAARLDAVSPAGPIVRLVPGYDPYLLGYRRRDLAVDPEHARAVHPGGGVLHSTILVDGRAAATWKTARRRGRLDVSLQPFATLDGLAPQLEAEVGDVVRFLEEARQS